MITTIINKEINRDYIFFGEVGLSGEIRSVSQTEARLIEAHKLGFKYAVMPKIDKNFSCKIEIIPVHHIKDLLKLL